MKNRKNAYSIRKLSVGASSIIVASMLFIGGGSAHAAESEVHGNSDNNVAQSIGADNEKDSQAQLKDNNTSSSIHNDVTLAQDQTQTPNNESKEVTAHENTKDTEIQKQSDKVAQKDLTDLEDSQDVYSEETQLHNNQETDKDTQSVNNTKNKASQHNQAQVNEEKTEQPSSDETVTTQNKNDTNDESENVTQKDDETQPQNKDNSELQTSRSNEDNHKQSIEQQRGTQQEKATKQAPVEVLKNHQQNETSSKESDKQSLESKSEEKKNVNNNNLDRKDNSSKKEVNSLSSDKATDTQNNSSQQTTKQAKNQNNKKFPQIQYKNHVPIILVHGFNGYTADNGPAFTGNYWGGSRIHLTQELRAKGYNVSEASVSALGSNYDRAVELYYYIKGGTVDYGAAHAAKYGHERYGKSYAGAYKDWKPGQKIHLIGHSMGGQTVRLLEELLRNGNPEEIEYQKQHGGEISPLFKGGQDNMISSITTLATPHNGTHAADLLGNEAIIRQIVYDFAKSKGTKLSHVDPGLRQWGLKQRENESYIDYMKRVKQSKLWNTKDNGFYDLTTEGTQYLNEHTSLNPNIVYKTYTGESTNPGLNGVRTRDMNMNINYLITANVIGKLQDKAWRLNDGLVSVISAQHPFNQAYQPATEDIKKGVWQVMPVKYGWDHGDFVGSDSAEKRISIDEFRAFWDNIAEEIVRDEKVTDQ